MRKLLTVELKPNRHISSQLLRMILSWYMLLAITVTIVQLGIEYKNEKDDLSMQVDSMANTLIPTLSEALWNYDEDQMNASMNGFYKNKEIYGITIQSHGEETEYYRIGFYIDEQGQRQLHLEETVVADTKEGIATDIIDVLYMLERAIPSQQDETEILGTLTLYYSSSTVIQRTYKTLVTTVIMAIIKTIGLWILAVSVINRLVAKPVNTLRNDVIEMDLDTASLDDYKPPNLEEKKDINEIQYLRECFEALKVELSQRNHLIQQSTNSLQNNVLDKTNELTRALEELTRANQVKSEFLSNISHELRTPLNSIIGFTNRILVKYKDQLDERMLDGLQTVRDNGKHLLALVNDLLDISKIEAGKLELTIGDCYLQRLLDEVLAMSLPLAKEKNLTIDMSPACVEVFPADTQRVKQVLLNLLSNAIKFSEGGNIKVNSRVVSRGGHPGIEIRVIDSGVGIPSDSLSVLFDRFQQVESENYSSPGTGLGLAIAKELMNLHHGDISVESEVGKGSEFILWFPVNG